MTTLIDTNILLRAAQTGHPMHKSALESVALLKGQGETLCVAPQNLYEFWVVCTRPQGENGLGRSITEAEADLARLRSLLKVLDDTLPILPLWETLVVKYRVAGKSAHDTRLVAAMIENKIGRILTFNTPDFRRYPEIEAVAPDEVLNSSAAKNEQIQAGEKHS